MVKLSVAALVALLTSIVILFVAAFAAADSFEDACKAAGGHVVTKSGIGTGINPANGQPVITTTNTDFCVSADGRILEVD